MLNRCISVGEFPDVFKLAVVTPIFKKGDPLNVANYRPISVLLLLAKVFEKCIHTRLVQFLDASSILNQQQFGFRRGMSTEMAILKLVENVYEVLNNKQVALDVFIDFRRAFDTVQHTTLFRKLQAYGIGGLSLKIFKSFLNNRKQAVKIKNHVSSYNSLTIGLPQGSALSATLFLIYINDLPNFSDTCQPILYADDTTLCFKNNSVQSVFDNANINLENFNQWAMANRLSINSDKTNFMLFSNLTLPNPLPNITLNGYSIEHLDSTMFLGLKIDCKLRFDDHVEIISSKIAKSIGIIKHIANLIPVSTLLSLYYALIHPYLIYAALAWGSTYEVHLKPIIILQKKAIRAINKVHFLAHTTPLFFSNRILKFLDLIKY